MGEPQEIKGSVLVILLLFLAWSFKPDQLRLFRVDPQAVFPEPFRLHRHDPLGITFQLAAVHKIISIPDQVALAFQSRFHVLDIPLV